MGENDAQHASSTVIMNRCDSFRQDRDPGMVTTMDGYDALSAVV